MTERSFIFVSTFNVNMTKADKTKKWIIEQAAPIFNKRGVAGTAMSDIMEATKLSKGSLYVHFQDKEELSYSAVDFNLNLFVTRISEIMGRHKTAKEKLLGMLDSLSDPLHPPIVGGCPMLNFGLEADDTNPVILQKVNKTITTVQQGVSSLVQQGIKSGQFRKTWNPKIFATKMFALLEGGILLSRVSGKRDQMEIIIKIIKDEVEENSL